MNSEFPLLVEHSGGYLLRYAPSHPLCRPPYPRVFEHRFVFYEHCGAGPFDCHWCGDRVTWDDMHVDHLNDDKKDNRIDNLVASCPICNQQRGFEKAMATKRAKTGLAINGEVRTMNEWAEIAGISRSAIRIRLSKGWPPERAVFEPRGKYGPKKGFRRNTGCHAEKTAEERET